MTCPVDTILISKKPAVEVLKVIGYGQKKSRMVPLPITGYIIKVSDDQK